MADSSKPPVLIVGAGPVGLTLALELTRLNIAVRIIDKAVAPTQQSKALVIWSRTLELLGARASAFVDAGLVVTKISICNQQNLLGRLDVSAVPSAYPFALMIPQSETERLLEDMLNKQGVRVERGVEAVAALQQDAGVQLDTINATGLHETLHGQWLIGCDGAHSLLRKSTGGEFAGETLDSHWVLGDVHIADASLAPEVSVHWHRTGILVVFPISRQRYRVIANIDSNESGEAVPPSLADLQRLIDERTALACTLRDPVWLAGFRINDRKLRSYRYGRIFLAGDAAHIHSPAGGQGMNTGMQDAFNLAWKLALVIKGICREDLLDSYSAERSLVGDDVLKSSGRLTKIAILEKPGPADVAQLCRPSHPGSSSCPTSDRQRGYRTVDPLPAEPTERAGCCLGAAAGGAFHQTGHAAGSATLDGRSLYAFRRQILDGSGDPIAVCQSG
ncbi:FAD-dependent monooxygenase [Brucella pseudogrignonensis]|uniref:FAD-dependent monooxygenase n=1 Tax=Brucella pseudogrignonensis TaxID=419475 RepID=UPI000A054933|nr:FAD-dependent monooxygenase [Brucella pseudogrignonensis]